MMFKHCGLFFLALVLPLFSIDSLPHVIEVESFNSTMTNYYSSIDPKVWSDAKYAFYITPSFVPFFAFLQRDFHIDVAVETGTWKGETTSALSYLFNQVHTIEILDAHHAVAKENLQKFSNVECHLGSSPECLANILPDLKNQRILFYLDASWSSYWPLFDELREISKTHKNNCIIVINCVKVPDYPKFAYIAYESNECSYTCLQPVLDQIFTEHTMHYLISKTTPSAQLVLIPKEWKSSLDKSIIPFDDEATDHVSCSYVGQLGNQMYQIATVLAFALDHNCIPVFPQYSEAAGGAIHFKHIFHRLKPFSSSFNENIQFEDHHHPSHYHYYPIPYESGENIKILGHYMNVKYFSHHKKYLQRVLGPDQEVLNYIRNKYGDLEKLLQEPTVAVHVRTFIPAGFTPDRDGLGFGGATWDYFINAINLFPEDYNFLVFSDEPNWTAKNFPKLSRKIRFIDENPLYIDFYFMSLCHHQIVSPDSTFSWWAAFLNTNPQKKVICPHYWQHGYAGDGIYDGAFPDEWIKIPTKHLKLP